MYLNMEELVALLWKGSRPDASCPDEKSGLSLLDPNCSDETSPRQRGAQAEPKVQSVRLHKVPFHIPHTAIFSDGQFLKIDTAIFKDGQFLKNWYFCSNGYLRKKILQNLIKTKLIAEFLRMTKPGYFVATLICIKECDDGFFSTQRILLEDPAFSKWIKSMDGKSGIFQQLHTLSKVGFRCDALSSIE
jgi:hypothetical protein